MTTRRLNRAELLAIVGGDQRALRAFERVLGQVPGAITGTSRIELNYSADGVLVSPLPLNSPFSLSLEGAPALTSGVTWGVTVLSGSFVGAVPVVNGTGAAQLSIRSGLASDGAVVAVTARVAGAGYAPFSVTISRNTSAPDGPGGGSTASDTTSNLINFNSGSFVPITRELSITLSTGVTQATLTAGAISLGLDAEEPTGVTNIEAKWQRETAPAVWGDVGAVAIASPSPNASDSGFTDGLGQPIITVQQGVLTCNRTETGLAAGSQQKFRLVARSSGGNLRPVYPFGTASASS